MPPDIRTPASITRDVNGSGRLFIHVELPHTHFGRASWCRVVHTPSGVRVITPMHTRDRRGKAGQDVFDVAWKSRDGVVVLLGFVAGLVPTFAADAAALASELEVGE